MGEVVAVIKIMPNGVDVDLEKLKENLAAAVPAGIDLNGIAEEPIGMRTRCSDGDRGRR